MPHWVVSVAQIYNVTVDAKTEDEARETAREATPPAEMPARHRLITSIRRLPEEESA